MRRPSYRLIVWLSLGCFGVLGAFLVRNAQATRVTYWMLVYDVTDFTSIDAVVTYVQQLRLPIPIVVSLLEIGAFALTGSTALVNVGLYRIAFVLAFLGALRYGAWREQALRPGRSASIRLGLTWLIGLVFLWSTVLIHPGNPMAYDLFYPCLCLGYLLLVRKAQRMDPAAQRGWQIACVCLAAGFLLSMAELIRPFVLYLLPVVLWLTYRALHRLPRRYFLTFLLPLVLFSGTWHAYQIAAHDQLAWGNHSGFNLIRAWISVPPPALVAEINSAPLAPGRWANLNTPEHSENNRRLQTAVVQYVVDNPLASARRIVWRVGDLMAVRTSIYRYQPTSAIFSLYRVCVWLLFGLLVINSVYRCYTALRQYRRSWRGSVDVDAILLFITAASLVILATGDAGEEARFLISILPLLLACPLTLPWRPWRHPRPAQSRDDSATG